MGEFSRYASFLELAFGVNLLFGAWDGIYGKLSQLSQHNTAQGEQALELAMADSDQQQTITKHRERCDRCRTWMRKAGRAAGLVLATAIAVSLLLVAPDQAINAWQFGFIAGAGAVVPLLLAIMVIGDYGYTKWITGKENAMVRVAVLTQATEAKKASQIANQVSASASPAGTAPTATAPPAESPPAESPPAESAPTESAPTESAPTESAPAESAPAESAPAESAPAESAPAESAPAESAPAESAPAESAPAESAAAGAGAGAGAGADPAGAGPDPTGSAR